MDHQLLRRKIFLLLVTYLSAISCFAPTCSGCRIIAYAGEEKASGQRLLSSSENGLPQLAYEQPSRWSTLLRATAQSEYWDEDQSMLRNRQENRDGWGVGWWEDDDIDDGNRDTGSDQRVLSVPQRFRSARSLVDSKTNATSKQFLTLLSGNEKVVQVTTAFEGGGNFKHSQGFLGLDSERVVSSCGVAVDHSVGSSDEDHVGNVEHIATGKGEGRSPGHELESRVIFGHVRAASPGLPIDETNSHPFIFNTLLWMHNGALSDFETYRETLLRRLRPSVRGLLAGSTDSEYAGALFVNNLEGFSPGRHLRKNRFSMAELRGAMRTTIAELRALSAEAALELKMHSSFDTPRVCSSAPCEGTTILTNSSNNNFGSSSPPSGWSPSSMNFAVSDGVGLVVTRFRSSRNQDPPTLYYKIGLSNEYRATSFTPSGSASVSPPASSPGSDSSLPHVPTLSRGGGALTVASEPLETTEPALSAWRLLGKDRMISFHPDEGVRVECISDQCTSDTPADFGAVQEAI